jgi:hypothetical protein
VNLFSQIFHSSINFSNVTERYTLGSFFSCIVNQILLQHTRYKMLISAIEILPFQEYTNNFVTLGEQKRRSKAKEATLIVSSCSFTRILNPRSESAIAR